MKHIELGLNMKHIEGLNMKHIEGLNKKHIEQGLNKQLGRLEKRQRSSQLELGHKQQLGLVERKLLVRQQRS
jgi:hypothetical protein